MITSDYFHGDNFIVEDLLDLSNEDDNSSGVIAAADGASLAAVGFSSTATAVDSCRNCVSGGPDSNFSGGLSGDLCEPHDELLELEWLSNFVEESFSRPNFSSLSTSQDYNPTSQAARPPRFCPDAPLPGKARSKRSRVAPCNWSSRLVLHRSSGENAAKDDRFHLSDGCRKCAHCGGVKTPQWRTGPMGPKTLCNACGVRYKSGRLVPEYRPAASPTFVPSKHSNSHRKVLELRRQKEVHRKPAAAVSAGHFLTHSQLGPDCSQLMDFG